MFCTNRTISIRICGAQDGFERIVMNLSILDKQDNIRIGLLYGSEQSGEIIIFIIHISIQKIYGLITAAGSWYHRSRIISVGIREVVSS